MNYSLRRCIWEQEKLHMEASTMHLVGNGKIHTMFSLELFRRCICTKSFQFSCNCEIINNVSWFLWASENQQWDIRSIHFNARLLVWVILSIVEVRWHFTSESQKRNEFCMSKLIELLGKVIKVIRASHRKLPINITSRKNQQFSMLSTRYNSGFQKKFLFGLYVMPIEIEMLIGTVFPTVEHKKIPPVTFRFIQQVFPFRCLMNGKLNEMENIFCTPPFFLCPEGRENFFTCGIFKLNF